MNPVGRNIIVGICAGVLILGEFFLFFYTSAGWTAFFYILAPFIFSGVLIAEWWIGYAVRNVSPRHWYVSDFIFSAITFLSAAIGLIGITYMPYARALAEFGAIFALFMGNAFFQICLVALGTRRLLGVLTNTGTGGTLGGQVIRIPKLSANAWLVTKKHISVLAAFWLVLLFLFLYVVFL